MANQDAAVEEILHGATLPTGTEVASYAHHHEAQAAVDYLSEHDYDIRTVSVVGMDVHLVEHITGRLSVGRVAFSGASSGLLWGAVFGFMMSLTNSALPSQAWIGVGIAGGALLGMILALVSYAMRKGKRDFMSHTHVMAARYAIIVESNAQRAFELLQKTPGNQRRPARPKPRPARETDTGPTEYGSRPDEKPRFGVRLSNTEDEETHAQSGGAVTPGGVAQSDAGESTVAQPGAVQPDTPDEAPENSDNNPPQTLNGE